tara:strand:+ start:1090 stop:1299 length:210 start_codon:yes stop_codon:yes gene_type:complete
VKIKTVISTKLFAIPFALIFACSVWVVIFTVNGVPSERMALQPFNLVILATYYLVYRYLRSLNKKGSKS